MKYMKLANDE